MQIADMHNHILPGMDDGCADISDSIAALQSAREQGVEHLFLTPHYYAPEPVEEFLRRRNEAMDRLTPHIPEGMQLCLGAEVAFFSGISRCLELGKLCLGNSRYMLLEMPFGPWDSNVCRELQNLIYICGIQPILAHVERYLRLQSRTSLKQILEQDVLVQMNGNFLLDKRSGREGRRMLRQGKAHLLGSDCHNNTQRSFNLGSAMDTLEKHRLTSQLQQVAALSMDIFRSATSKKG